MQAEKQVKLKVGAQVVMTRNLPSLNLYNGSRGVVVDFSERKNTVTNDTQFDPIVQFSDGLHTIFPVDNKHVHENCHTLSRLQIPLVLGWALTAHRAQGMTLDRVEINMSNAFMPGQAYVALSRVKSLKGLKVMSLGKDCVYCSERVSKFYEKLWRSDHVIKLN